MSFSKPKWLNRNLSSAILLIFTLLASFMFIINVEAPVGAVFTDGFEDGVPGNWDVRFQLNGLISQSSEQAHHGSYSAKVEVVAADGYAVVTETLSSPLSTAYMRTYVYFTAFPADTYQTCFLRSSGDLGPSPQLTIVGAAVYNDSGTVKWAMTYENAGSYRTLASTPLPQLETWYCVEIKTAVDGTVGEARMYVNNLEILTQTGLDNDAWGDVGYCVAGSSVAPAGTNGVSTAYIDCVVVGDGYIGLDLQPISSEDWWDPGWRYRKMITVDSAEVEEDLTDFPTLIDLTDMDLTLKAQADGGDIAFTDEAGSQLSHEIEFYDAASGHLIAWVRADLSSTTDTVLYMYYGNADAPSQENPTDVWDSNYMMVHHLQETAPPSPLPWTKYAGNPTLSGTRNGFASVFYDGDTGVYHLYCSWGSVLHFNSTDGINWSEDTDNNPVLSGNGQGVPMVWKEGSTWYMLYRYGSPVVIGLATSPDATTWTEYSGNPVVAGDSGEWDDVSLDPWGVMKVGSTYYLWYNTIGGAPGYGSRCTGLATSTDLMSWTKDLNNPIFTGGRFCVFPFKYGSYYYMLVPRYTSSPYGEIELYRDLNPTFYSGSREYLGVVINPGSSGEWDDHRFDTPCVLTDTIYRDTYSASGDELWVYYASTGSLTGSGGDWWTGMCIETDIAAALPEPVDNVISDSTSNGNDGGVIGNLDMDAAGMIDGADYFLPNNYIDCGDSATLKGMTGLTIEVWVKPERGNTGIVAKWSGWSSASYILWQSSSGAVGWGVITDGGTASFYDTPILQNGRWCHLVGVYDGSQIRLYSNASQVGSSPGLTGTVASTSDPCLIGHYATVNMEGTIDEVRISNVARSEGWISTEFNNQQNPSTFYTVGNQETLCTLESCDSNGFKQDSFNPNEDLYVTGSGYMPSATYQIYVVSDQTTWSSGSFPARIPDTVTEVGSNSTGHIPPTTVWSNPLTLGTYDIAIDVNGNGVYDAGVDPLDDNDVVTTAGFFVIPEFIVGGIVAVATSFAVLGIFRRVKRKE